MELRPRDGARGFALSASKEIEPGARAMLLIAHGLFRFDVVVADDTIRTVVRNLSSGELEMEPQSGYGRPSSREGPEAAVYRPGATGVRFSLGSAPDRVEVDITVGILRFSERGTVQVTGQAIVREAAA